MVGIISSGNVSGSPVENEIIELDREKISAAFGPRFFLVSGLGGNHGELSSGYSAVSAYQDEWDAVWIAVAAGREILLSPSGVPSGADHG